MSTFVEELAIRGFKSFHRKSEVQFTNKLNCVVGSNGSGKSNILDSVCFVLGRLSTKSIRAENYADLLYKKGANRVPEGEVSIIFNNEKKIFPMDSIRVRIDRRISESGLTAYYINRKRATRKQVLELLSLARIMPEGHNIILQGDIANFINLSSIDKRKLVEEIAGIHVYESKKESALNELTKVDEKLKEAKIVITEKKANLNSLEAEKNIAEKYRSYKNEQDACKATELKIRYQSLTQKKAELNSKLSNLEEKQTSLKALIEHSKKKSQFIKEKIELIEDQIEKKGGDEQLAVQKEIDDKKSIISSSENLITSSENEIQRIELRIDNLNDKLSDIQIAISEKEKEVKSISKEKDEIVAKITRIKSSSKSNEQSAEFIESSLKSLESELESLKESKSALQSEIQQINSSLEINSYKLSDMESKIKKHTEHQKSAKEMNSMKENYKKMIQEINSLAAKDSSLAVEISELRRKAMSVEEKLSKIRIDANETQELILRDRAVSEVLSSKKSIQGIINTVSELGSSKKAFSKALAVVAGAKMKNIVVESADTAVKCLKLLKESKSGFATFLPLDKIRTYEIPSSVSEAKSKQGVIGLAYELISSKPEHQKIFKHIFRDTLVVEDVAVAKTLGIGKYSMVTLDGDVFSSSGAITGGFRRDAVLRFSDKSYESEIDSVASELSALKSELKRKEEDRRNLEEEIISMRQEKAELESRISSVSDSEYNIDELEKSKLFLESELKKLHSRLKEVKNQIPETDEKIARKTVEKNASASKLRDIKFGEKSIEVRDLEGNLYSKESSIASIKAAIENVLSPELENIQKVIKSLEKEKVEFKTQITQSQSRVLEIKKELSILQKTESEFFGQLKKLFEQKREFSEASKQEEEKIKSSSEILFQDKEESNSISIAKAKVEAETEAVVVEIEPFKSIPVLPHLSSALAAKKRYTEISEKLESFGSVNMKALEVYESVKKEYDELSWKVEKLSSEKQSIHNIIEEIEKKKHDSFIETYKKLNENFKRIFERISEKMSAELFLENAENPFEAGVSIRVIDNSNKKLYLASLSGGQKALVALAFIFAVQEFEPAPFYLLDEIDAALDKVNSKKVAELLKEYSEKTQIIMISHNDEVISHAESLYGIWMNKDGESQINSLKL